MLGCSIDGVEGGGLVRTTRVSCRGHWFGGMGRVEACGVVERKNDACGSGCRPTGLVSAPRLLLLEARP